jgi:hypothetical protein
MKRVGWMVGLVLVGAAALALRPARAGEKGGEVKLFNGQDLTGWRVYLGKKGADAKETFQVRDGVIHCTGKPNGYILTDKEYSNYVLKVKWRWPGKPGNSGVFVHVVGPDKIWPKAVEAQLMADHAGDFWLVDNFKLTVDPARQDKKTPRHYYRLKDNVEKTVGEWNQYEITCKGDTVRLVINGQLVNEGTNAELTKGRILLQSEGSPIEFKDVVLTHLSK